MLSRPVIEGSSGSTLVPGAQPDVGVARDAVAAEQADVAAQGTLRILDRRRELPPDDRRAGRAAAAPRDRAAAPVEPQHDARRGVVLGLDRAVAAEGPAARVVAAEVDVVERLAARALLVAGPVAQHDGLVVVGVAGAEDEAGDLPVRAGLDARL